MMSKVVRCFECGSKNYYEMKKEIRKYNGEGYSFELEVEVPVCMNCGSPISVEEIEYTINKQANEIIKKKRSIISIDEIQKLLFTYNVSQKFLSKLLGWGEITLTRYITGGYTPNTDNSNKLKELYNPYVFLKLLNEQDERTNGKIKNEVSFMKAQYAVENEIVKLEQQNGKIYQVVNWFMSQTSEDNPMTHLALQKMLYFVQAWSMAIYNHWMFQDDCEAWVHGAVYRTIYNNFKCFGYMPLPKINRDYFFSNEEFALLNMVKTYYFDIYNAKTLETICHKEKPYMIARKGYSDQQSSSVEINKEDIKKYYKKIASKYLITDINMSGINEYLFDILKSR